MRPIQIVCDSTAAFTAEEIQRMGLEVVPLSFQFNGESIEEGLPNTYSAFYEKLAASKAFPTTSQPPVSRFQDVFERALSLGRDVVAVLLSGGLSGTCSSAQVAAEHTDPSRITVIDSQSAVAGLKNLVTAAWLGARAGNTAADIKAMVEERAGRTGIVFTVGDLLYLKRGGRLNNSQYFVGKLLNILPLLTLREGKIYPQAKVKGIKAMLSALQQAAPDNTLGITLLHINNPEAVDTLRGLLLERFPGLTIGVEPISPVIGCHLGPGALGYCFHW